MSLVDPGSWQTPWARFTLWRWRILRPFRRPRVLKPEAWGLLFVGGYAFPIDEISFAQGQMVVSGECFAWRGRGPQPRPHEPDTYQLLAPDGSLIHEGPMPNTLPSLAPASRRLRITVEIPGRGVTSRANMC